MSIEIKVPELPESVAEASVGAWYTSQGDQVERDQNLVDLETDKVMLEVPAIASGVLTEIRAQAGATVQAGDVLGILEEGEAAGEPSTEPAGAASPSQQSAPAADRGAQEQREETQSGGVPEPSPAARKLMEENDLTPDSVPGSGKDGRITKADVQNALAAQGPAPSRGDDGPVVPVQKPEAEEPLDASELADRAALAAGNKRLEQRVPMTRIRARIAERLLQASQNTAMLTTFNEINMHAVTQARVQYKEEFEKHHGVRLGFMSFFVKAAIEALKRFPIVNASIDDQDIVYHGYYDIGIAVSSPRGLLVPILRDADQLSYAEIEDAVHDLGKRARDAKITLDELTGGTFTITNGGVYGSMQSTPILNPPQSAILGMHAINKRAVVVDDEIAIRPIMEVALSYDHRIIDGRDAVLFLRTIKELVEDPARLLLQI